TRRKIARRRDEGCIVVDMEVSALLAVGRFRGVQVGALLYAADDVSGEVRDGRGWTNAVSDRQEGFELRPGSVIALSRAADSRSPARMPLHQMRVAVERDQHRGMAHVGRAAPGALIPFSRG